MLDLGIRVKVDLIIGLPGDTVESVRRGIDYVHRSGLYSQVQVFNLAVLPGTSFREEAKQLGLVYQDRPPYYVLETPTLTTQQMYDLMAEAEEVFETEFDPLPEVQWPMIGGRWSAGEPRPSGSGASSEFGVPNSACIAGDGIAGAEPSRSPGEKAGVRGLAHQWIVGLDDPQSNGDLNPPPAHRSQAFTLWLRSSNFHTHRRRAAQLVDQLLADNPFTTLQIVLEAIGNPQHLTPVTCDAILQAALKSPTYLDRFYSVQPGRLKGAKRIVILLPETPSPREETCREQSRTGWSEDASMSSAWQKEISQFATIVYRNAIEPAAQEPAVAET